MVPQTSTKAKLLEALKRNGEEATTRLRALAPAEFEAGRYEGGWNGRQILAHVAAIEWTYGRLIDVARQAPSQPALDAAQSEVRRMTPEESGGVPTRSARGGIDDYNARQVQKRSGATVAELLDEFAVNRAKTIAAVEIVDEDLLATPIRSAGGITGQLGSVIMAVAVQHVMMHVADITGEPWQEQRW